MAKVFIAGKAIIIRSSLTLEQIQDVYKFRPESLVLRDENNEPVFGIGYKTGKSELTKFGISFNGCSQDGFAELTFVVPNVDSVTQEFIIDTFGSSLIKFEKLEKNLADIIGEIESEKYDVSSMVDVI